MTDFYSMRNKPFPLLHFACTFNVSRLMKNELNTHISRTHGQPTLAHNIILLWRQSGMAVRMPTSINQLFNGESIAVQMLLLDIYTWNSP